MSLPTHVDTPIDSLNETYDRLNARFATHVTHSVDYRTYNLKQLAYLVKDNEEAIQAAIKRDLDSGSFAVSFSELFPIYNEIDLAVKKLPEWMKDETRGSDAILAFRTANLRVKKQPKGVALIIGPWNYPWMCNIIPLIGAIAAGCPAIVKPSELAPTSAALMAELIPRYLDPEAYAVVLGGIVQATKLLEKRWGHILYTGSGTVGRIVATAAAKTLTPSTLELGGKSPVFVSSDADVKIAARRMMSIKQLAIGQMCVAPDYILCEKDRVDDLIAACTETSVSFNNLSILTDGIALSLDTFFPPHPSPNSYRTAPASSALLLDRYMDRQMKMLEKADSEGKVVYNGGLDKESRRMGITIVKLNENGTGEKGGLVEEEIFGPILPIIPVQNVDAAIAYINARDHPLALYVCSRKRSVFQKIVDETISGAAVWNDFATSPISRSTPFGGVGDSGWGSYHGYDGFRTFSHFKTTADIALSSEFLNAYRYPPMTAWAEKVVTFLLSSGVAFSRPTSVEHEASLRKQKRLRGLVLYVIGAGAVVLLGWAVRKRIMG